MNLEYVIEGKNIQKKYKGFALEMPQLQIPKGFATALIGENGAGKLLSSTVENPTDFRNQ
jgi:ABC-2 type transport system ATP-binding protein